MASNSEARTTRHHERIVDQLGMRVVSGHYPEGDLLPREDELVAEFDVSRGVVREAIRVLSAKGLTDARPRRGTMVLPKQEWHQLDPAVINWRSQLSNGAEYLRDLMELRQMIEPAACAYAAERARPGDLALISACMREMWLLTDDEQALIEADMRFHHSLLVASQNELVVQVSSAIEASLRLGRQVTIAVGHSFRLSEHQAVADAVLTHSKLRARRAMSHLLELSSHDIVDAVRNAALVRLDPDVE